MNFTPLSEVLPGQFVMVRQGGGYHLRHVTRATNQEIGSGCDLWTEWGCPLGETEGRLVDNEAEYKAALDTMTWLNLR